MEDSVDIGAIEILSLDKYNTFICKDKPLVSAVFDVNRLLSVLNSIKKLGAGKCVVLLGDDLPILVKDLRGDSGICLAPNHDFDDKTTKR